MKTFRVVVDTFAMDGKLHPKGCLLKGTRDGALGTGLHFRQLEEVSDEEAEKQEQDPQRIAENMIGEASIKRSRPLTAGEVFDMATTSGVPENVGEALLDIAQTLGEKATSLRKRKSPEQARAEQLEREREAAEQAANQESARQKAEQDRQAAEQAAQEAKAAQEAAKAAAQGQAGQS